LSPFPPVVLLTITSSDVFYFQERLYANLGPTRAPFATPTLNENGEITWHSFLPGDKGQEAEVYGKEIDVFFAGSKRPGIYEF
jgi:hypothetical protein